jgi:hypothetical protein
MHWPYIVRVNNLYYYTVWQAFVLMNRAIRLAVDEGGFPRIAHEFLNTFLLAKVEITR